MHPRFQIPADRPRGIVSPILHRIPFAYGNDVTSHDA